MIKQLIKTYSLFIPILILLNCSGSEKPKNSEIKPHIICFETNGGWGYNIELNGKAIIHQPFIPAIKERMAFATKEAASKAAELMIDKLKKGQIPALSIEELVQNKIIKQSGNNTYVAIY